jgi:hypothetical protein
MARFGGEYFRILLGPAQHGHQQCGVENGLYGVRFVTWKGHQLSDSKLERSPRRDHIRLSDKTLDRDLSGDLMLGQTGARRQDQLHQLQVIRLEQAAADRRSPFFIGSVKIDHLQQPRRASKP